MANSLPVRAKPLCTSSAIIAKFKDTNELNTFIKDLVKDPNIERTYTQTVLDVIKEDMGSSNIL